MNEIKQLEKEKNKAVNQGKWKEAGEYCNCIGATLFELGEYDNALKSHCEELEFYDMIKDPLGMAVANRKIGECYAALNNFKKALYHVNLFLELSKSAKSAVEEQRAWATLGRTYYMQYKNETDPESAKKIRDLSEKASLRALELLEEIKSELSIQDYAQAKSRLLLNVGLVCEDHDLTKCAENIRVAIYWASKYDLYEDLNRCQYTLADVYRKHEQYRHAIRLLDGAIETAERLRTKTLSCDALCSKASILLSLNDFEGGKQCFKKAYKIRHPNKDERDKIVQCLRICTGLCMVLKELERSENSGRKQLFEKIADGLSSLECYKQALHYYQETLNCLEELNCPAIEKAPIYFSIAETYRDLGEADKAIEHFKMELNCNKNKPREQVKTLWEMVELYEEKQDLSECEKLLISAASLAEAAGISKLLVRTLRRLLSFYEKNSMQSKSEDVEAKLKHLKCDDFSSDEESEPFDESETPFSNVSISESDEEEAQKFKPYPLRQRQRHKPVNSRNIKGETPLHKACIEGDLSYAKKLIESGVNVNARDNAGWTPLHEACNYGHYMIVEYLLRKGANVNDRGGKKCYGVTPLHDACTNGHLDVVKLLLSKGAHPTTLSDDGKSALQFLLVWKDKMGGLDKKTLEQCDEIENLLKAKMKNAGQDIEIKIAYSGENIDSIPSLSNLPSSPRSRLSDKRSRSPSINSEDDLSDEEIQDISVSPSLRRNGMTSGRGFETDDAQEGASAYKSVISSLRRSAKTMAETVFPEAKTTVQPALISEDKAVDDWLVQDTINRPKVKKRKMSNLSVRTGESKYLKIRDKAPENMVSVSDESQDFVIEDTFRDQQSASSQDQAVQQKTADKNLERNEKENFNSSFYLKVRICDKLILVPILEETTCMYDLAEEAAKRYRDIFGSHPILRLTKLGALLRDSDTVKTFFVNGEEVLAFVESWVEQSAEESYVKLCKKHKLIPLNDIKKELANCDEEMNLSHRLIPPSHINPLFSAISEILKIKYLDISGILLTDSGFHHLVSSFPAFEHLVLLNVNCCCLTFESIKDMSNYLTQQKEHSKKLPKLETLNLGNNLLFSKLNTYLIPIFQLPSLTAVHLNSCNLDFHLFENSEMCELLKNNVKIEDLNISGNYLGKQGVSQVLSYLPKNSLKKLDLSHTVETSVEMGLLIDKFLSNECYSLKEIILEGCHLVDTDLNMLSKCLSRCPKLQLLNMSSNFSLSAEAICTFLRSTFFVNSHLVEIILTGTCQWDCQSTALLSDALRLTTFRQISLDSISVSLQLDLFKIWKEIHCDKALCVNLSSRFCELRLN